MRRSFGFGLILIGAAASGLASDSPISKASCSHEVAPAAQSFAEQVGELDVRSEDGGVVISAAQILSYEWSTHTLSLAPQVRAELARKVMKDRAVAGVPYVVAVGGKTIYKGKFVSVLSSMSFDAPMIVIDGAALDPKLGEERLRIQLGYPTPQFFKGKDPRGDDRIRNSLKAGAKLAESELTHVEYLEQAMRALATLKPGMTRAELLNVCEEEGGLSTRTSRRYVYRGSRYVKVDVVFEPDDGQPNKLPTSTGDRIVKISRPYLEWSIMD